MWPPLTLQRKPYTNSDWLVDFLSKTIKEKKTEFLRMTSTSLANYNINCQSLVSISKHSPLCRHTVDEQGSPGPQGWLGHKGDSGQLISHDNWFRLTWLLITSLVSFLSVWSLHVLPVFVWVSSRCFHFPHHKKHYCKTCQLSCQCPRPTHWLINLELVTRCCVVAAHCSSQMG